MRCRTMIVHLHHTHISLQVIAQLSPLSQSMLYNDYSHHVPPSFIHPLNSKHVFPSRPGLMEEEGWMWLRFCIEDSFCTLSWYWLCFPPPSWSDQGPHVSTVSMHKKVACTRLHVHVGMYQNGRCMKVCINTGNQTFLTDVRICLPPRKPFSVHSFI